VSRYFRRQWDELRSSDHASWGQATYYFETDDELIASRQIEVYDGGQRLCYDVEHPEDEHGFLDGSRVFPDDEWPELFEISARQFETEWKQGRRVST